MEKIKSINSRLTTGIQSLELEENEIVSEPEHNANTFAEKFKLNLNWIVDGQQELLYNLPIKPAVMKIKLEIY